MNNCKLTSEWKVLKFEECITQLNTGLNPRNNFKLGTGKLKYITAKNLTKYGTIDFSKCEYIDEAAKQIINKRSDIKIGDVLLSSRAPIGQCHLIKENPDFYDIGESIFSIRANKNIILPEYLCLYLSSDFFVKVASKNTTGSIIKEIRIGDLMKINVVVPPMSIQKKIADCLNALDGKIANNNAISAQLESLANTIYNYWFLQFEFPNEEGKPYKSSGGKMVWNEELKREIPEGWISGKLQNLFEIGNGKDHSTLEDGIIPVYGSGGVIRYANNSIYTGESVLIPRKGTLNNVMYVNDAFWTVDTMYYTKMKMPHSALYTFFTVRMFDFEQLNIGSAVPSMTSSLLYSLKAVIPPQKQLKCFDEKVKPIYDSIIHLQKETQQLASLRDFLLPLLMNGQVTFKDEATSEEE